MSFAAKLNLWPWRRHAPAGVVNNAHDAHLSSQVADRPTIPQRSSHKTAYIRMSICTIVCKRILPAIIILLALLIGWFAKHDRPLGLFFATLIPLLKGIPPPSLVGHGKMKGTPEIPPTQSVEKRPAKELFLTLPGTNDRMPQVGLGMCCRPTAYDDVLAQRTVAWFLLLGGRHIDGAHLYLNHEAIGRGIQEAMARGGVPRDEIFITTKVFPSHFGYNTTLNTVQRFPKELGLDYIDLVLMHGPSTFPLFSNDCTKRGINATACRQETWKALSELRNKGIIRNIGVSNFAIQHLKDIQDLHLAPIANNQIQYSPFSPASTHDTVDYCHEHNITITAYSPLGGLEHSKATTVDTLQSMATKYDKSIAQIMLRWALQRGTAVIPGTGNPNHMRQNLAIYDFEISNEDMNIIDSLKESTHAKKFMHMDVSNFA
jgi:diketogulonate reductase-like aldo/keto reductase